MTRENWAAHKIAALRVNSDCPGAYNVLLKGGKPGVERFALS